MAEKTSEQAFTSNRLTIGYLDGMRGLTAMYVMLGHALALATLPNGHDATVSNDGFSLAIRLFVHPHYAVAVFIVISGFCLMLPVARSQNYALPGGLGWFIRRRALRILPPYYAALILVLVGLTLSHRFIAHADSELADMSLPNIISHLLLIHNLFARWNMALDFPMWSVAWEWQIYFLFALVLLPIVRIGGLAVGVVVAFALGFAPLLLLGSEANFSWTCPWYVGLFALGMVGAVVFRSAADHYRLIKNTVFQNIMVFAAVTLYIGLAYLAPSYLSSGWLYLDCFFGAATATFIVACGQQAAVCGWRHWAVVSLESKPVAFLGAFSYSIYLVHYPILLKFQNIFQHHHLSHYLQALVLVGIGMPLCLCAAYIFHLMFERPFLRRR